MIIKNYTLRDITMSDSEENMTIIKPDGKAPKVIALNDLRAPLDFATSDGQEFHSSVVVHREMKVIGLPEKEKGTMLIVSPLVLRICGAEREDLISICEIERGKEGEQSRVLSFRKV